MNRVMFHRRSELRTSGVEGIYAYLSKFKSENLDITEVGDHTLTKENQSIHIISKNYCTRLLNNS